MINNTITKIGLCVIIVITTLLSHVWGAIPAEYRANYKIATQREDTLDILVKIDAAKRIGSDIDPSLFQRLNTNFSQIFPFFPPENTFKIVYQQCLDTSLNLASSYDYNRFTVFVDRCFDPLNDILQKIESNFSVNATITATPKAGSAPMTVTFDARSSLDPSNDTVPRDNFFWYYKDINGQDIPIGRGPVINHTFETEGNYIVHLTVRSANQKEKGIFDGTRTISINVGPQSAIVSIFANGKRMRKDIPVKIGTQEAQRGVVFDGTPTQPRGGRTILKHTRQIAGPNNFTFNQIGEGSPNILRLPLNSNGEYKITINIQDNENNTMSESYRLIVSDPIATIKMTPQQGNTSTTYNFDASASYSVISNIRQYTRDIFDDKGDKIDTIQNRSFSKDFKKPGQYKIKLTVVDELNQSNFDEMLINVESTPPIAQFLVTPLINRKHPSQFILDASASSDIDVTNGHDALSYERKFSNAQNVVVERSYDEGKRIITTFNEKGIYKVRLIVTDNYGKRQEIEKDIKVDSALRPILYSNPTATIWGRRINFLVRSEQNIANYERNFGDGTTRTTQVNRITYAYDKVGTYNVTLKVTSLNGDTNEITRQVFVGEQNQPILSYEIKNNQNVVILQNDSCQEQNQTGSTVEHPAFKIGRYENFSIDISSSVNVKGEKKDLKFFFQPKNEDILARPNFSYRFTEIGCQRIDISVEDNVAKRTVNRRVWFNVINTLPVMDSLTTTFPQYGGGQGPGLQNPIAENANNNIFQTIYDPLVVRVGVQGARDLDGFISYFTRYYYDKNDPSILREVKITPNNIPFVFFSVPRVPGEYMFGVKITDNDGGEITSEQIIGNGPAIFFPPDTRNIDIPIVTLKANQLNVKAGDEVTLEVISSIISNRSDFEANRIIKYDFDGDGNYDLTTKRSTVKHIYKTPGEYNPNVKVLYRGYAGTARIGGSNSQPIIVSKGMSPKFLIQNLGKNILIRNISVGNIENSEFCLDDTQCNNQNFIKSNENTFFFEYPSAGNKTIVLNITDEFGNQLQQKREITLTNQQPGIIEFMSLPSYKIDDKNTIEISVGKSLDNQILFYIPYQGKGQCFIDTDIAYDSDGDSNSEQDKDVACNQIQMTTFEPKFGIQNARLYYEDQGKLLTREIIINFIDIETTLPDNLKKTYNDINTLIIALTKAGEKGSYIRGQLIQLRNNLTDIVDRQSYVLNIRAGRETTPDIGLSEEHKQLLESVLVSLSDGGTQAALGGTEYENAKKEILTIIPESIQKEVISLFEKIDNNSGNKDDIKIILEQILNLAGSVLNKPDGIDEFDLNIISLNICKIVIYHDIQSENCKVTNENQQPIPEVEVTNTGGIFSGVLGTILWIIGGLLGLFILLVIGFAVKARLNQNQ